MRKRHRFLKLFLAVLCLCIMGCVTMPKGFLKLSETSLEKRQLQMRQYDTTNEEQIVAASKKADATNGGQVAGAAVLDILAALSGSYSNAMANCDRSQVVKASIITRLGLDGKKITVRVTFQRIVWNMDNQISKVESINDPKIYQKFYDGLSKAIFLEAQKI